MYSPWWMKLSRRWRILLWRINSPYNSYGIWMASIILSYTAMKAFVTAAGPKGNHNARIAADGSYKNKKFGESSDNPLYRLPEQPQGGHRVDGLSPWAAKAAHFEHH